MSRKKKQTKETTTFLVMVHSDGSPAQVLLPDGRMAIMSPEYDLYACTRALVSDCVLIRKKDGGVEVWEDASIDDVRSTLMIDGFNVREINKMKIEKHPIVKFG
jgi:hypothetical protein